METEVGEIGGFGEIGPNQAARQQGQKHLGRGERGSGSLERTK